MTRYHPPDLMAVCIMKIPWPELANLRKIAN